jgi:hypothetical protein
VSIVGAKTLAAGTTTFIAKVPLRGILGPITVANDDDSTNAAVRIWVMPPDSNATDDDYLLFPDVAVNSNSARILDERYPADQFTEIWAESDLAGVNIVVWSTP